MSRIDRKNWLNKDIGIKNKGGMIDLFDNMIKTAYRITDEEYDHLCEIMNEDEMDIFVNEKPTFADKRKMIELLNIHINYNPHRKNSSENKKIHGVI